ncbi:MAG: rod shape-determining protein MreD [Acidobacteria bacterium]|nr:rod shape-determining protein MreD [Acidobacteriota bacterium]
MTWVWGGLALLGTLFGQLFVSSLWPSSAIFFDLPLLVVLYYGLDRGPVAALLIGAGVGIVQDSLTGSLLGAASVARGLTGYVVGAAGNRFVLTRPLSQLLVIAGGTLAVRLLDLLTLVVMGRQLVLPPLPELFAGILGNTAVGWTAFQLLRREKAV